MEIQNNNIIVEIYNNTSNIDNIKQVDELTKQVKLLCKRINYINNYKKSIFGDTDILQKIYIDKEYINSSEYQKGDFVGYGYNADGVKKYFRLEDIAKTYKKRLQ